MGLDERFGLSRPYSGSVARQDAAAGPRADGDAELQQRGVDAPRTKFRILLQFPGLVAERERGFGSWPVGSVRLVLQAGKPLSNPAL